MPHVQKFSLSNDYTVWFRRIKKTIIWYGSGNAFDCGVFMFVCVYVVSNETNIFIWNIFDNDDETMSNHL